EAAALEAHVETCLPCQQVLAQLADAPGALPDPGPAASPADEEAAEDFLRQLAQQPPPAAGPLSSPASTTGPTAPAAAHGDPAGDDEAGAPPTPQQLGDCRLLTKLGEGGMGTVYRALHTLLGKQVAVKVLAPDRRPDPQAVARFRREIQALGQLNHPN